MSRIKGLFVIAVVLALSTISGSRAWGADLTGIWLGEQNCDSFDGQKFNLPFKNDVMVISQSGQEMNLAALFFDNTFHLLYQGHVIDDDKEGDRKAQAAFTECETTPSSDYQETGRATKVELKKKGDGEFEATSIYFQTPDGPSTGTCKWKYKRASTEDVGVPSCITPVTPGLIQTAPVPHR
jgi:hypothetical protein